MGKMNKEVQEQRNRMMAEFRHTLAKNKKAVKELFTDLGIEVDDVEEGENHECGQACEMPKPESQPKTNGHKWYSRFLGRSLTESKR
jgi:hypothetical protein